MSDGPGPRPFGIALRRWLFFVVAVATGVACLRLGFWQLARLEQRRAANATIRARLDLPLLHLPGPLPEPGDLAYRRAVAVGMFDNDREVYLSSRSRQGIAGVHVVAPLQMEGQTEAVLVDRGWIPETVYRGEPGRPWAAAGEVEITGILRPSQEEPSLAFLADRIPEPGEPPLRTWRALHIPGLARQLPYPVLEVYLAQDGPPSSDQAPVPAAELDLGEGPHLGYAIQWFAFAAIAWIGGLVWLRRPRE